MATTKWQRFTVDVSPSHGPRVREAIGLEVLDFIRKQSAKGLDKKGKRFRKYTKGYIKSLDFKNAGKSAGKVNIRLSGDTIADMDILSDKAGQIIIGFENNTLANSIADGNIRGTYGRSSPTNKKREFLGITKGGLRDILRKFPVRDKEKSRLAATQTIAAKESVE